MRKKKLKMKLGQLQKKYQKHLCQLGLIYVIWPNKNLPFMRLTLEEQQKMYSLLSIMLHITPWTLMLILHIRQSIYLVLTIALSASFLIVHIKFDEISLQFQSTNISLLHMYWVHLSLPDMYRQCCADFEINTTLSVQFW